MIKFLKTLFIFSLSSTFVYAQMDITMTKAEFVDSQINLLQNVEKMQADFQAKNDEMMKSRMPEEQFKQYKADQARSEKIEKEIMAECLGISTAEIASIEKKVGPEFQIGVVKSCSSKLPESINLSAGDFESSPVLAAYAACAQKKAAAAMGVAPEKLAECSKLD